VTLLRSAIDATLPERRATAIAGAQFFAQRSTVASSTNAALELGADTIAVLEHATVATQAPAAPALVSAGLAIARASVVVGGEGGTCSADAGVFESRGGNVWSTVCDGIERDPIVQGGGLLGSLAQNGGRTPTVAIDASVPVFGGTLGTSATCAPGDTDQRGVVAPQTCFPGAFQRPEPTFCGDRLVDPQPTFTPALVAIPVFNALDSAPLASTTADVDGDGSPDVVVLTAEGLFFLPRIGGPTLLAGSADLVPGAAFLAAGDLNGNGTDLVVANANGQVFSASDVNVAAAPFPVFRFELLAGSLDDIALTDLDGDALADLVVAGPGGVKLFAGDVDGFASFPAEAGTAPSRHLRVADVDGNGILDVIASLAQPGPNVTVVLAQDGSFALATPPLAGLIVGDGRGMDVAILGGQRVLAAIDPSNGFLQLASIVNGLPEPSGVTTLSVFPGAGTFDLLAAPGGLALASSQGAWLAIGAENPLTVGEISTLGTSASRLLLVPGDAGDRIGFHDAALGFGSTEILPSSFQSGESCELTDPFRDSGVPCNGDCEFP
jgi:hypothetical protein